MQIPRERLLPIIAHQVEIRHGLVGSGRYLAEKEFGLGQAAFEIAFEFNLNQESVARNLRRFLHENVKYVNFNTADQWLVGLGVQHMWHTELGDLYELGTSS